MQLTESSMVKMKHIAFKSDSGVMFKAEVRYGLVTIKMSNPQESRTKFRKLFHLDEKELIDFMNILGRELSREPL